uniref:DUF4283 domain-containing protein n=1 Tax=Cannabis sativa TaxID=3483 RepID=A0A803QIE2_CANSA
MGIWGGGAVGVEGRTSFVIIVRRRWEAGNVAGSGRPGTSHAVGGRERRSHRKLFLMFIHANEQCNSALAQGMNTIPPVLHSASVVRNLGKDFDSPRDSSRVKIEPKDIEEEVQSMKDRDTVLNGGYIFFNQRPIIMKPWDPNTNFRKEYVKNILIWIQLEELDLKYWGQKSLFKIVGQLGNPIMVDEITKERDHLKYPRVLVEVKMNQELLGLLEFDDEHGMLTRVGVKYEWKPTSCSNCGMGHGAADCRKNSKPTQEWVIKDDKRKNIEKIQVDDEGFQRVTKSKTVNELEAPSQVVTQNTFSVLTQNNSAQDVISKDQNMENDKEAKQDVHNNKSNTREGGGWCFSSNIEWHRGGRIVIAWNPLRYNVDILKCTSQLMHLKVSTTDAHYNSFLTVVYAYNDRTGRQELWKDLNGIAKNESWLLMGDFNDILAKDERIGHKVKYQATTDFMDCIMQCHLEDVKATGSFFT